MCLFQGFPAIAIITRVGPVLAARSFLWLIVAGIRSRNPRQRHPTSAGLPAAQAIFCNITPSADPVYSSTVCWVGRPWTVACGLELGYNPIVACHTAGRLVTRAAHIDKVRRIFTGLRVLYRCTAFVVESWKGQQTIGVCCLEACKPKLVCDISHLSLKLAVRRGRSWLVAMFFQKFRLKQNRVSCLIGCSHISCEACGP